MSILAFIIHIIWHILCMCLNIFSKWCSALLIYPSELAFTSQYRNFSMCV